MGVAAYACSLVMLLGGASIVARRLARRTSERFWIAVAAGTLFIDGGITLLSIVRQVMPVALLAYQAVVLVVVLLACGRAAALRPRIRRRRFSRSQKFLIAALAVMILLTCFEQCFLAVSNQDDRNYRAARAAYWLQHQSIAGWETHNDRQVAFPPGGSIPFFHAILFSRNETAGLLATWTAYPLAAIGAYVLLRSLHLSRTPSLLGTLAFCFTPIVLLQTRGVQPELWLTLYTLGCAFWSIRAWRRRRHAARAWAMACLFAVLAVNVRTTALPLVLMPLLLSLFRGHRARNFAAAVGGAIVALLLSGLLPILLFNAKNFGHPLGSAGFRETHQADITAEQLRAHASRAIVVLIEPPFVPDRLHQPLERALAIILHATDGDAWLPREEQPWPGHFVPQVHMWAENFSLPGVLWIPILLLALRLGARRLFRGRRLRSFDILTLFALVFLLAAVFLVRWMGVIGRFWIAPYALFVIIATVLLAHWSYRSRRRAVAIMCFIALFALPATFHRLVLLRDIAEPPSPAALAEPYGEALLHIPPGSRILLLAGQATRDYPLFHPHDGFPARVTPWGKKSFDAARLVKILADEKITHVLIEDDRAVDFYWVPPLDTGRFVAALAQNENFRQIPLPHTPHVRLFARRDARDVIDPSPANR